jgi:pimeloyl-ACP methyl ester carboxylesterase
MNMRCTCLRSPLLLAMLGAAAFGATVPVSAAAPTRGTPDTGAQRDSSLLAAPDRFAQLGDVRIRYREIGQGEPLVLLHGYSDRVEMWAGIADSLAQNFRVIALDVRGFGLSTKSAEPAWYGMSMVDDVVHLMDQLRIRRAHVAGYSMGGQLTAQLVARHPNRLASATLIGPPVFPDSAAGVAFLAPFRAELDRGGDLYPFLRWAFPAQSDSLVAEFTRQAMADNDRGSLAAVMQALGRLIIPRSQPDVRIPLTVVVGTSDPIVSHSRRLAQWWPAVRLVEVDSADHLTILFHPELVAQIRRTSSGVALSRPAP